MRPAFHVAEAGTFREITLWKAIVFGILTIGIYVLVVTYGHTKEMQEARERPFDAWKVLFWIGIIPFVGFLHWVLYAFNWMGFQEMRAQTGQKDTDALGIVALILAIVLPPVGHIIWTVHFNGWLTAHGQPAAPSAGTPAQEQPQTA